MSKLVVPLIVVTTAVATVTAQEAPTSKARAVTIPTTESEEEAKPPIERLVASLDNIESPALRRGMNPAIIDHIRYELMHGVRHPTAIYTEENLRAVREIAGDVASKVFSEYQDFIPVLQTVEAGLKSINKGIDNATPEMQGEKYRFDTNLELGLNVGEPVKAIALFDRRSGKEWRRFLSLELSSERAQLSFSIPGERATFDFHLGYSKKQRRPYDPREIWMPGYRQGMRQKEGFSVAVNGRLRIGR